MTYPTKTAENLIASAAGTTVPVTTPAVVAGQFMLIMARGQGTSSGTLAMSIPGWTAVHAQGSGDRAHMLLWKIATGSEPASYTLTTNATSGRIVGAIQVWSNVDSSNPIAGFHAYASLAVSTTQLLSSWTVDSAGDQLTVVNLFSDERTAGQSHVPTTLPSGYSTNVNAQSTLDASTSGSRSSIWSGYMTSTGTTTIAAATLVMPTGATSPKASAVALRGVTAGGSPVTVSPPAARMSITARQDGFASVAQFLTTPGATAAWRLGGGPYPQHSKVAAQLSSALGYKAMEFSCGWTSDLVPFGLGPQYLDTIAGVSGSVDPTTMTWATLSSTYQIQNNPVSPGVYQPFYRLVDFLADFASTHICLVDPKYGFDTVAKIDVMLDLCDLYGGPSRILIKFDSPTGATNLTTRAHTRGYTCINYWGTDTTTMAAQQANWDAIGVLYSASAGVFATADSYGKPVWGAVVPDQAGYDNARTNGADFMNVSGVTSVAPVTAGPVVGAPVVTAGAVVQAVRAQLTVQALPPVVQGGASAVVNAVVASVSVTARAPVVSSPGGVVAPAATLSIVAFAPTVQAGSSVVVSPPAALVAVAARVPVVSAGAVVAAVVASLVVAGRVPVVGAAASVAVPVAALVVSAGVPVVSGDPAGSVRAVVAVVVVSVFAPTVSGVTPVDEPISRVGVLLGSREVGGLLGSREIGGFL